jgi:23S rRNA (pseudouridine1915-N3)-methyltransferase
VKTIQILTVGRRRRDQSLDPLCDDYYRRCSRRFKVQERQARDLRALLAALPPRGTLVALDERGQQLSSPSFARRLERWLAAPPLVFVIGGADGLDPATRERAAFLLSLGEMTFAHRLVRLLLAEQLYRAVSILEGAPYHRG